MTTRIPLFPLHTVLVPGAFLSLRIFEPRYLDLISECLRQDTGFGVNLIKHGGEVGEPATVHPAGTYARIVDWQRQPDGLLGITIEGQNRFRVRATQVRSNRLLEASIDWSTEDGDRPVSELDGELLSWLRALDQAMPLPLIDESSPERGAAWLGFRLLERLPLPVSAKQALLEIDEPVMRLEKLRSLVQAAARQQQSIA